jgi:hypothetical protein
VTSILYDIHGGLFWDEQFASLWPPTPPATSHGHLLIGKAITICDQSNSDPVSSVRGRNVAALSEAAAPLASLDATEF